MVMARSSVGLIGTHWERMRTQGRSKGEALGFCVLQSTCTRSLTCTHANSRLGGRSGVGNHCRECSRKLKLKGPLLFTLLPRGDGATYGNSALGEQAA